MSMIETLANYIVNNDREEQDYIEWCDDNGLDASDIHNPVNQKHIWAVAQSYFTPNDAKTPNTISCAICGKDASDCERVEVEDGFPHRICRNCNGEL